MRDRLKPPRPDFRFDQMFETHSEAWERVGLARDIDTRTLRTARRRAAVLLPLAIAVVVVYNNYQNWFGSKHYWETSSLVTPIQIAAILALLALGWAVARDIGRAIGPTFFKRMDPSTAGTVGFIVRLVFVGITLLVALNIAGASASSIAAGSAFTAVIIGLAAQQTLGNLFAGMVLLSARPFRVGERVRLQAGAVAGQLEGVVSSLGLLYTTLARGEDRIQVPNNVVLSAAVLPIREPEPVDVRVRLATDISVSQVQAILDDRITTPTRRSPVVLLQEVDGNDVVVRVQATPDRADDGARLADEVIEALSVVTAEHPIVDEGDGKERKGEWDAAASRRRE
ncbi:MAG: mechanosensitive ion channel family protein [Solirubrobacterales bacterium]|nr:mechanosensitive ion channel family protein [Solirubrobacterales bacterium]MBV9806650.1 mechanosensitive ion channel family protein [Solirubrobacterales bacterium]